MLAPVSERARVMLVVALSTFAIPKSRTFVRTCWPRRATNTFAGFTSRCAIEAVEGRSKELLNAIFEAHLKPLLNGSTTTAVPQSQGVAPLRGFAKAEQSAGFAWLLTRLSRFRVASTQTGRRNRTKGPWLSGGRPQAALRRRHSHPREHRGGATSKAGGMATNEKNVSSVGGDQEKRTAKPAAAANKPAKVATKPTAKKAAAKKLSAPTVKKEAPPKAGGTKTDFVRAQPEGLSASEVVARAKAAGVALTSKSVHTMRSKIKAAKAIAKRPAVPSKAATKNVTKPEAAQKAPTAGTPVDGDVVSFRRLVLGLGTVRARKLLDDLERGIAALLRG